MHSKWSTQCRWISIPMVCKFKKTLDQYAMYLQCTSKLVDTFRLVFGPTFTYEGSRAIVFPLNQKIPEAELKECIKACLRYHKVKDQMTLGI